MQVIPNKTRFVIFNLFTLLISVYNYHFYPPDFKLLCLKVIFHGP